MSDRDTINRRLAERVIAQMTALLHDLAADINDEPSRPRGISVSDGLMDLGLSGGGLPQLSEGMTLAKAESFANILWHGIEMDEGSSESALRIGRVYQEASFAFGTPGLAGTELLMAAAIAVYRQVQAQKAQGEAPTEE